MPLRFSADQIWAGIAARIEAGVNQTAEEAERISTDLAPVRKVFRGSVGRASMQSALESAAESQLRRDVGVGPGPVKVQRMAAASVHSIMRHRRLAGAGRLRAGAPKLTSRGRYELRSGRANVRSSSGATLGGRLRSEIHMIPSEGKGPTWTARVVSPTRYAKYVEFGTRHSRAQPFLRPALAQVRESFRQRMAQAVRGGR